MALESQIVETAGIEPAQGSRRRGFIYFIQAGVDGPIKIGITVDPLRRLDHLQCANAERLMLLAMMPGDRRIEQMLHRGLKRAHLRGEWFAPSTPKMEAVLQVARDAEVEYWRHVEAEELVGGAFRTWLTT